MDEPERTAPAPGARDAAQDALAARDARQAARGRQDAGEASATPDPSETATAMGGAPAEEGGAQAPGMQAPDAQGIGAQGQPSDMEMFLAKMLRQSEEVSGDFIETVGGRRRRAGDKGQDEPRERPMTAAEAQLVREREAVDRVVRDVRIQSSKGALVQPARWDEQGMVPEHMSADEFAVFVMDSISAAQEGQGFEGSGIPAPADDEAQGAGDGATADGADGVADVAEAADAGATPDDGASGVVVGPGGRADEGDPEDDAGTAGTGSTDGAPAAPASCAPAHEGSHEAPMAGRADGARAAGTGTGEAPEGASAPSGADTGASVAPASPSTPGAPGAAPGPDAADAGAGPATASAADAAAQGQQLVEPKALQTVHDRLECDDIVVVDNEQGTFLYSNLRMSDNYAKWSLEAQAGDDVRTLVENVRDECRIYPRPLLASSLRNAPFRMTDERIREAFERATQTPEYADLRQCEASNGDVYYYSTKFMHGRLAKSLAEFYSVERFMSV